MFCIARYWKIDFKHAHRLTLFYLDTNCKFNPNSYNKYIFKIQPQFAVKSIHKACSWSVALFAAGSFGVFGSMRQLSQGRNFISDIYKWSGMHWTLSDNEVSPWFRSFQSSTAVNYSVYLLLNHAYLNSP